MSTLLGDISEAALHCDEEIALARKSEVPYMLRLTLAHEAHLLHYRGLLREASRAYEEARAMVASCPPDYPLLALYEDVVFVEWYWSMAFDAGDAGLIAAAHRSISRPSGRSAAPSSTSWTRARTASPAMPGSRPGTSTWRSVCSGRPESSPGSRPAS